jgi:hypothetical protein
MAQVACLESDSKSVRLLKFGLYLLEGSLMLTALPQATIVVELGGSARRPIAWVAA